MTIVTIVTCHVICISFSQVPGELLDNVLRITHEIDPEALDYLLNVRAAAAASAASKQGYVCVLISGGTRIFFF